MDINKVIGLEGGSNGTWFKILGEEGRGETAYYPAVVNGIEKSYSDFPSIDDYFAAKVKRTRLTIRLTVAGNAVSAEEAVRSALGCHAMANGPTTVDVYPDTPDPFVESSKPAAALGRKGGQSTSPAKSAAAAENGKRGGRPRKQE